MDTNSEENKNQIENSEKESCQHLNLEIIETGQRRCKDCTHIMPGRKPGGKNQATIEKDEAKRLFEERILRNIQGLLTSQMNIAKGASYVYRIHKEKGQQPVHILVSDPDEIKDFLDELEGGNGTLEQGGDYYYITTKAPENKALDSLIDRVFGKAPLELKHSGEIIHQITGMKIIKETNETNRIPEQEPKTN